MIALRAMNWKAIGGSMTRIPFVTATFGDSSGAPQLDGVYDFSILDMYPTSLSSLFKDCRYVKEIDISSWTHICDRATSLAASWMFQNCYEATKIVLPTVGTVNISAANFLFQDCRKVKSIDLTNWMFADSAVFQSAFSGCNELESLTMSQDSIGSSIDLWWSSALSVASGISVCNAMRESSGKSIRFSPQVQTKFESDSGFVSARDAAVSRGVTIKFA